ncbi:uncharacterized protein C2845_PM01G41170 [Panicum miliaceum]|uniref:WRC domain-containing protein n=1 Tax=Panicum miliaceum TaxID=4540 RepID=A0A3L6THV5_PANMI|nr:uncharacterized protein C2845_PM01G41170 [Panicum miliaceum]
MRIRKRAPARAADPGPAPALAASASPPRPPPLQQQLLPEERRSREEEEKRVILVAGVRVQEGDGDRVPAAASNDRCVRTEASPSALFRCLSFRDLGWGWAGGVAEKSLFSLPPASPRSSATDDVPEPEPQDAGARCTRNDGKRWRCKGAAVPGYLFCARHVAWSTRKRKPRPNKHKQQQQQHRGDDDGFLGGFQKRAKVGEPGPAA